jgi:ribosomal protein S18 acetylase RimI-like enzyme
MSFPFLRTDADLRRMTADDAPVVGDIIYRAIARAFRDHGQPEPIADAEHGGELARLYLQLDPEESLVALREGRVVAAGFLHIRDEIASLGPVVVDPDFQGQGLGKQLVSQLADRASRCASTRLFVDAFNTRAFGIALKRGFLPRDTGIRLAALGGLAGRGMLQAIAPAPVRDAGPDDLEAIARFDSAFFGGGRGRDFRALFASGGVGLLAEEGGAIRGYLLGKVEGNLAILGPGGAETADLLGKLLARLGEKLAVHANIFLAHLYASQPEVVHEAFSMGFRATNLSIYMVRGAYTLLKRPSVIALPPDVV